MKIKTQHYTLSLTSPGVTVTVPPGFKGEGKEKIGLDLGDRKRGEECVVTFLFESSSLRAVDISGTCQCMSGSIIRDMPDGTQQFVIKYKSSRIGREDPYGEIVKQAQVYLVNGEKIKFNFTLNGVK